MENPQVQIGHCQIDLKAQVGYRMGQRFFMRPKMWSLLLALLEQPNALVTTTVLLQKVWPNQDVNPRVLTNLVHQLRAALGPLPSGEAAIQSVPRRGYLLLVPEPVEPGPGAGAAGAGGAAGAAVGAAAERRRPPARPLQKGASGPLAPLVGRSRELESLRSCVVDAQQGVHSVSWLLGEAGLGKSTLIEHLLDGIDRHDMLVLLCRCLDLPFEDEPFSPLVKALNEELPRRVQDDPQLLDHMRQTTPCWLLQMPSLIGEEERASLKASLVGSGPGRMLREGLLLMQRLASRHSVLLVLEDAQWAERCSASMVSQLIDEAPPGLMLLISARPEPCKLMPTLSASVAPGGYLHGRHVLSLKPLTLDDVAHYLEQAVSAPWSAPSLAQPVFELTGGHPLYISLVVAALQDQFRQGGAEAEAGMPLLADSQESSLPNRLAELVRMRTLTLDRQALRILDVASCIPDAFVVPLLAKVLSLSEEAVVTGCEAIAERGLFRVRSHHAPWFDGRLGVAYEFSHALIRAAHHGSLDLEQVRRLHELIAGEIFTTFLDSLSRMLGTLSTVSRETAMREELAMMHQARAQLAYTRFAPHQVRESLQSAIEQYELMPVSAKTRILRIGLLHELHQLLFIEKGLMHPEVQALRHKMVEVGADDPDPVVGFYVAYARTTQTLHSGHAWQRQPAEKLLEEARRCGTPTRPDLPKEASAHLLMGLYAISDGDFDAGLTSFDTALALSAPPGPAANTQARHYSLVLRTWTLALTGRLAQPMNQLGLYSEAAKQRLNPSALLLTLFWSGDALRHMQQFDAARRTFEELVQLSDWYDCRVFGFEVQVSLEACKPPAQRSIPVLESMLEQSDQLRSWSQPTCINHLCETALAQRDLALAERFLDQLEQTVSRWGFYRVDVLRMKAELAWLREQPAEAEVFLNKALEVARDTGYAMATCRCVAAFREALESGALSAPTARGLSLEAQRIAQQLAALQYPQLCGSAFSVS